jgi:hypothetical protein
VRYGPPTGNPNGAVLLGGVVLLNGAALLNVAVAGDCDPLWASLAARARAAANRRARNRARARRTALTPDAFGCSGPVATLAVSPFISLALAVSGKAATFNGGSVLCVASSGGGGMPAFAVSAAGLVVVSIDGVVAASLFLVPFRASTGAVALVAAASIWGGSGGDRAPLDGTGSSACFSAD